MLNGMCPESNDLKYLRRLSWKSVWTHLFIISSALSLGSFHLKSAMPISVTMKSTRCLRISTHVSHGTILDFLPLLAVDGKTTITYFPALQKSIDPPTPLYILLFIWETFTEPKISISIAYCMTITLNLDINSELFVTLFGLNIIFPEYSL